MGDGKRMNSRSEGTVVCVFSWEPWPGEKGWRAKRETNIALSRDEESHIGARSAGDRRAAGRGFVGLEARRRVAVFLVAECVVVISYKP